MQKTILLTGATGFLGSHLLESFIKQKLDVVILKRSTSDTWRINDLLNNVRVYDVDKIDLKTIFGQEKIAIIINTVCSYGRANESLIDIINSNLIFGLNLLEEAIKNRVQTFINTDSLLPRNINDYSLSKAQFSDWLFKRSDNIQVVNFKIEHMYGPKDDEKKFLPWLINKMVHSSEEINLTSGIQKRDFIYISDVVNAYNIILQKRSVLPDWNQFDVGTNVFTEVKEFVLLIAERLNKNIIPRLNFGAIPYRAADIMMPELDNTALITLGWNPKVTVKEGASKVIDFKLFFG